MPLVISAFITVKRRPIGGLINTFKFKIPTLWVAVVEKATEYTVY